MRCMSRFFILPSRPAGDGDATLRDELPEVKSCRSSLVSGSPWGGGSGGVGAAPPGPTLHDP